ncbi:hypothetical protein PSACC_01144 [Paramicrosporidium saccamoebae]|uniref:Cyclin N-terminal domain-containing protein n=1 Tax=Paramicrosporidium saccamoebae TaxID=1246581 RepID=A0A2H9TMN5_9FUNG|nr:hypothetical protein PSACC_01144 [Paramicrosporidium saccamoebae]
MYHQQSGWSIRTDGDERSGEDSWNSVSPPDDRRQFLSMGRPQGVDVEWRTFLGHWNQPMLRMLIAERIPDLVAIIWQREFVELPLHGTMGFPPRRAPADEDAVHATRKLLHAILNRTRITTAAMLLALFFVHRYRIFPDSEVGCAGSQYRMFLVGMLLAHKYSEDHPFSNRVWAQLSELQVSHVNVMERDFLRRIDHRLSVQLEEFQLWVVALDRRFGWTGAVSMNTSYRTMPLPPIPNMIRTPAPVQAKNDNSQRRPASKIHLDLPTTSARRNSHIFSL